MKFRKKPVVIEAHQWFKNGDHPDDYVSPLYRVYHNGRSTTYPREYCLEKDFEGTVVHRYRTPELDGQNTCKHCGNIMHVHGWIDTLEGGHIVCPGDWIVTGVHGERYPCKPDIFMLTYEPVDNSDHTLLSEGAIEQTR